MPLMSRTRLSDRLARLGVTPRRVVGMLRQDPLLPVGLAGGWAAERLICLAPLGHGGLFDMDALPWTERVRDRWPVMRRELDALLDQGHPIPRFRDLHAAFTPVDAWRVHMFYAYGLRSDENCAACPETAALLATIPDLHMAMFSILPPHTRLPRHFGIYSGVIRYHLGLRIPDQPSQCGFWIDNNTLHWREGEHFAFDNRTEHEAWNDADEVRVILIIDVVRPLPGWLRPLNRFVLHRIAESPFMAEAHGNFRAFYRSTSAAAAIDT